MLFSVLENADTIGSVKMTDLPKGKWCECGYPHETGGPCWECRANPPDERHQIGHEDGETCNRMEQPNEEWPSPYPCPGTMEVNGIWENTRCHICGEIGD